VSKKPKKNTGVLHHGWRSGRGEDKGEHPKSVHSKGKKRGGKRKRREGGGQLSFKPSSSIVTGPSRRKKKKEGDWGDRENGLLKNLKQEGRASTISSEGGRKFCEIQENSRGFVEREEESR